MFQTSHLQNLVVVVQPVEWFISLIAYSVYQASDSSHIVAVFEALHLFIFILYLGLFTLHTH